MRPDDHVVHVGAGTGYYTAILAHLAGPGGRVTEIEFDKELADRATANPAAWDTVQVITGDGIAVPFDPTDVIYVNAGATRPADTWLDGLTDGGHRRRPGGRRLARRAAALPVRYRDRRPGLAAGTGVMPGL